MYEHGSLWLFSGAMCRFYWLWVVGNKKKNIIWTGTKRPRGCEETEDEEEGVGSCETSQKKAKGCEWSIAVCKERVQWLELKFNQMNMGSVDISDTGLIIQIPDRSLRCPPHQGEGGPEPSACRAPVSTFSTWEVKRQGKRRRNVNNEVTSVFSRIEDSYNLVSSL
jgi:hypothetical protein